MKKPDDIRLGDLLPFVSRNDVSRGIYNNLRGSATPYRRTVISGGGDWHDDKLRLIRDMSTSHIKAQIKYAEQKPNVFYGMADLIVPWLKDELERRTGDEFEDTPWNEDEDNQYTTEGNTGMNLKNMAALIREDITTIKVEHDETRKTYVYLCTRQLAQKVKSYMQEEGTAQVLVKNSRGTTLGDVVEVHDDPQVDLDYKGQYRYAFALVDSSEVDQLEKEDAAIVDRLQQQKKRSVRDQVLAQLGIDSPSQFLADLRHEVSDK